MADWNFGQVYQDSLVLLGSIEDNTNQAVPQLSLGN
jgi:hypothetical protein